MRKFLIVSFTSVQKYTGGLQCSRRNIESILELAGRENVIQYTIKPYQGTERISTKIKRVRDIFFGAMGGLDEYKTKEILNIISKENVTDLFLDASTMGLLAKRVKKKHPNVRVYTFFHNYEKKFKKEFILANKDYARFYWPILAELNEKSAINYSDKIIALNERDSSDLEKNYGRKPDILIPITLKGNVSKDKGIPSSNKEALFIGSYFYGNVEGIKWFCNEVLPHCDIHLTIVGASMDKLIEELPTSNKITVLSNVPELEPYYDNADFVILPILSGSGMKVKTAESLMHGKYILGTDEAFRGYDISKLEGKFCNTAKEFIEAINNLKLDNKFNKPSKDLFDKKYSFESSLKSFAKVLNL